MNKSKEKLVQKYLKNQCSADEARRVLEWFHTPEGEKYLKKVLNSDIQHIVEKGDEPQSSSELPDSDSMLSSIHKRIDTKAEKVSKQLHSGASGVERKSDYLLYFFKIAATVLVMVTGFAIAHFMYEKVTDETARERIDHYAASDEHQKRVTLDDGTVIHMNKNAEITLIRDETNTRDIHLQGEAYFEVTHDSERPFIVHADQAVIKVLGTAFNVKHKAEEEVQVAVVDGRVAFKNKLGQQENEMAVLDKGTFGHLSFDRKEIIVDAFAVENYLSWRTGRLNFNELSLDQVCLQLQRLYDLECTYNESSLKDLKITANFSDNSIEKVLSVISLTLDITYELEEDRVLWKYEETDKMNRIRDNIDRNFQDPGKTIKYQYTIDK